MPKKYRIKKAEKAQGGTRVDPDTGEPVTGPPRNSGYGSRQGWATTSSVLGFAPKGNPYNYSNLDFLSGLAGSGDLGSLNDLGPILDMFQQTMQMTQDSQMSADKAQSDLIGQVLNNSEQTRTEDLFSTNLGFQQGGGVPTTQDSLNLYKAMLAQQKYADKYPGADTKNKGKLSDFDLFFRDWEGAKKKLIEVEQSKNNKIFRDRNKKKDKGIVESGLHFIFGDGKDPEKKEKEKLRNTLTEDLIKTYESLNFEGDTFIGKYIDSDIIHKNIRPKGSYFDGVASSPIYEYPKSLGEIPEELQNSTLNKVLKEVKNKEYLFKNDINNNLENKTPNPDISLVDYLKQEGQPISFKKRKELAKEKGIKNYKGTPDQNTLLLNSLRNPIPSEVIVSSVREAIQPVKGIDTIESFLKAKKTDLPKLQIDDHLYEDKEFITEDPSVPNISFVQKKRKSDGQLVTVAWQNKNGARIPRASKITKDFQYSQGQYNPDNFQQGGDIPVNPNGLYEENGPVVIPSRQLTFDGINEPVMVMPIPGQDKVLEIPMNMFKKQDGGFIGNFAYTGTPIQTETATLGDLFKDKEKELTPAELTIRAKKTFKVTKNENDAFTEFTNAANKENRKAYLQGIIDISMQEKEKKELKEQDKQLNKLINEVAGIKIYKKGGKVKKQGVDKYFLKGIVDAVLGVYNIYDNVQQNRKIKNAGNSIIDRGADLTNTLMTNNDATNASILDLISSGRAANQAGIQGSAVKTI